MELRGKLGAAIAIPLMLGYAAAYRGSERVLDLHVEDKAAGFDLPASGEGSPQVLFLVYTDKGVFNIGREVLYLDFKAAERYHALKVGRRYRAVVAGWRVPMTNWYPRIVRVLD